MSGAPSCITATMPRARACTVPGAHLPTCDGYRYRGPLAEPVTYRDVDGIEKPARCRGCALAPAHTGLLCQSHASKLDYALRPFDGAPSLLVALAVHLWESNSSGIADGNDRVAGAFGSRVPIPESRIMANTLVDDLRRIRAARPDLPRLHDVDRLLLPTGLTVDARPEHVAEVVHALTEHVAAHVDTLTADPSSAAELVRLLAVTHAAYRRWPLVEESHRVAHIRCPGCGHIAMVWHPPLYYRDAVAVECADCGQVADQDWLEAYVAAIRTDPRRRT